MIKILVLWHGYGEGEDWMLVCFFFNYYYYWWYWLLWWQSPGVNDNGEQRGTFHGNRKWQIIATEMKMSWVCSTYTARQGKERDKIGNTASLIMFNFLMGMKAWDGAGGSRLSCLIPRHFPLFKSNQGNLALVIPSGGWGAGGIYGWAAKGLQVSQSSSNCSHWADFNLSIWCCWQAFHLS